MPRASSSWDGTFISVRQLQRGDEQAARKLFAAGMRQTITTGMRAALLQPSAGRVALLVAATASAYHACQQGLQLVVAVIVALVALFYFGLLPWKAATNYVERALSKDTANPVSHYVMQGQNNFWVAVDDSSDTIVGTVAVKKADVAKTELGHKWIEGDAELRRMSVDASMRGKGIARKMFGALRKFCIVRQCHYTNWTPADGSPH